MKKLAAVLISLMLLAVLSAGVVACSSDSDSTSKPSTDATDQTIISPTDKTIIGYLKAIGFSDAEAASGEEIIKSVGVGSFVQLRSGTIEDSTKTYVAATDHKKDIILTITDNVIVCIVCHTDTLYETRSGVLKQISEVDIPEMC